MTTTTEYALMAGGAYRSTRADINEMPAPQGWTESLDERKVDDATGFEAGYFQRGSEIVISYAGTYDKSWRDQRANAGLATGVGSMQLLQAVDYYLQVKAANPGATITLTGHSLGGGLASLVGVFFGVSAQTFDQAPFAKTALFKAPETLAYLVGQVDGSGNRLYGSDAVAPLVGYIEQKQAFGAAATFIPNSALISNINVQGEFLSKAPWTVQDRIGTTTESIANTAPGVSGFDLHSQALLTAFLQSRETAFTGQSLEQATHTLPQLLGMVFDSRLYSFRNDDARNRNFLDHLVRHEAGGVGGIAAGGDAMLSRFTADLNKLGTNIAGLNKAAQDALIAQGIEWYYWQGADYAGQEFFTESGGALQYTVNAADAGSLNQSANKALQYVSQWLDPLMQNGGNYSVTYDYEQWNVAADAGGATATARNADQTQIFIGNTGADTFTGGNKADLIAAGAGNDTLKGGGGLDHLYAGEGNDTLDGGAGGDWLYGGKGNDSYQLKSGELFDVINDSDGNGSISVDGTQLTGGKKAADGYWLSDDKQWGYSLTGSGDLVISNDVIVRDNTSANGNEGKDGRYKKSSFLRPPLLAHKLIRSKRRHAQQWRCVSTAQTGVSGWVAI